MIGLKKHKNKIIAGVTIAISLAFVFWYGGDAPSLRGWTSKPKEAITIGQRQDVIKETFEDAEKKDAASADNENNNKTCDKSYSETNEMVINETSAKDKYMTEPVPEGKPLPTEPQDTNISNKELTCTLSVRCDTILENIQWLDKEKINLFPKDGVIFAEETVIFYEGESVFNLLVRELKRSKIHVEFENAPIYNSAYIEGIANLYEFDCGELSGWMYKVNGWFPNYGCSRYQLKDGDKVEWVYTCNLGADVGGNYSTRNGR